MATPSPDLLKPRNEEDAHVRSGTQFLSLVGCSYQFSVHDPCRNHSIWYCLFLLGLTSSEMEISEIFHVALRVGLVTLRLSGGGGGGGGVNCQSEYHFCSSSWGGPRRSLIFPRLFRDHSLFYLSLRRDLSLSPYLLGFRSHFLSLLLFSF